MLRNGPARIFGAKNIQRRFFVAVAIVVSFQYFVVVQALLCSEDVHSLSFIDEGETRVNIKEIFPS